MSKKTLIEAKTFTSIYVEKEDRILLTINYQDVQNRVDFWITRAYLLKLLPHFFEFTLLKQEEKIIQPVSSTTNTTDNSTFLLTQQKPVLLESMDFTNMANSGMKLVFKNIEKQIYATSVLNQQSLNDLITLIVNTPPKYSWGISF